ncbi:MAG TPA: class II D-tagatose-bisphosphate aldolase, non-catalytic subunit [Actinomycetota bacterium]|nr:class II D-tagatose-bisphosphate aldolase, non-catalytic subunit [Actinomycetota bacterium]
MSAGEDLLAIVERNRAGERVGIASVCSAERFVLEAAMQQAVRDGSLACVESTCNQVNQFGGYTGMTPSAFRGYALEVAAAQGLPEDRLLLGGDHLGPHVWRGEPSASAMAKARELVRASVAAGYTKIHLDASMRCADDPEGPLAELVVAERTADLCATAEDARPDGFPLPVYVIGSEVPIPGGELADTAGPTVTRVEDVDRTFAAARDAFERRGLTQAWERVVALVVQPGVEFGDAVVYDYDPERARELGASVDRFPHLVFEAHSTDHQTADALSRMVDDHFAILKVGPWLTFAMREALFALELIEAELLEDRPEERSRLREVLERVMLAHPEHWEPYLAGDAASVRLARAFSYSDRARYYWARPELRVAVERLLSNLSAAPVPLTLLSQYLPVQADAVRAGLLSPRPAELIRHRVGEVVDRYASACGMR